MRHIGSGKLPPKHRFVAAIEMHAIAEVRKVCIERAPSLVSQMREDFALHNRSMKFNQRLQRLEHREVMPFDVGLDEREFREPIAVELRQ